MNFEDYQMLMRKDSNGTYVVNLPALPGCHAWGKTRVEAEQALEEVFAMMQEEAVEARCSLPKDVELVVVHAC